MSQNNSNETIAIQKARGIIEKINAVEEFDPTPLAVDYTDLKNRRNNEAPARYDSDCMVQA
ncbi:MAG: hypothetical protein L6V93_01665 [Clostridiales bacterium]|nr:MAG: hypothetical protein L6V93_01665 [Clostridiales bacterium]